MIETYTFTIVFSVPGAATLEPFLHRLADVGCNDAAFTDPGQDGTCSTEFDREERSFSRAVVTAIEDLRSAIPEVKVLRVEPDDLVTVSAIAARTGRTDESIRLLEQGRRGPGGFPAPLGHINEKTRVWRWADVADWFANKLGQPPADHEHAAFLAALNGALQITSLADQLRDRPDELAAVERFLPRPLDEKAAA